MAHGLDWYYQNREVCLERNRLWKKNNKNRVSELRKSFYANNRELFKTYIKKYQIKNKNKVGAWCKARKLKMFPCEICGSIKSHRHHPDYDKPLEVVYLCAYHHKQAHI